MFSALVVDASTEQTYQAVRALGTRAIMNRPAP